MDKVTEYNKKTRKRKGKSGREERIWKKKVDEVTVTQAAEFRNKERDDGKRKKWQVKDEKKKVIAYVEDKGEKREE